MDYCSSCRRHLNGALVCPGCGAYAPDIAPPASVSMAGMPPAATGTPAHKATPADAWFDGGRPDEPAPAPHGEAPHDKTPHGVAPHDKTPHGVAPHDKAPHGKAPHDGAPSGDVDGAPRPSQGRAARRRQLARWKKNKRRAAVATAVALVGGGLTLAALDRQSPDRAQAAAAPDNRPMGATDGQAGAEDRPESASPGTHRSPRTSAPARARRTVSDAPHGHTLATAPRTAAPDTHPDAAAAPVPARTPAAQQQHTVAPASGGTGTTAQQPSTPASVPTPASTPSTGGGTDSGTSPASPSPAATSPSQLCLLVVCIG
ncbi:hypothetical protein [Streptomyces sp. NPDC020362]|uniref:SCO2400 family protein n=1 Tax=unclassified Streptomyces TaxID=2593676 RepID=UPI0033CD7CAB